MTVEYEGKVLIKVTGQTCKRGDKYAEDEIVNPRRTLTSTVILNGAEIKFMPVKTSKPIEKDKLFEAMGIINKIKINAPVMMGDVLYEDFTESGINLVAGRDVIKML
jgi:CxxC motif-containing protein